MRIEFWIEGRHVAVEAEGAVSVRVSEAEGMGRLGADISTRLAGLRGGPAWPAAPEEAPAPDGAGNSAAPEAAGAQDEAAEADLFMRLSALRRELAAAGGVPPYVVFQDRALREMAEKLPQNLAELAAISGVGRARLEKYGGKFLEAIKGGAA